MPNENIPLTGLKGIRENWRSDVIASLSVALVALPLCLGIAVASGVAPMSGILSAIIGGLVTTFFRGANLTINGPAAGLIAAILGGLAALEGNINYVLAAIMISGGLQVLMGFLKIGRFAKMFPSSVLHGTLAAIGVIIFAKQIHFALGTTSDAETIIETLKEAIYLLPEANPFVVIVSSASILILIYHKKIPFKLFHLLPGPVWAVIVALPFVFGFDFFNEQTRVLFDREYELGPQFLITIPDNPLESIMHPDFSMIGTGAFWLTVLSITLIATLVTLASARAVDKLDPYKRVTDLNKDLVGVGLSTMVSGALGGLPIINVIVRSTVNVQNNAKTKWSNLYHGLFLVLFVLILSPVINSIPLAALAAILVHTGLKLASPKVFYHAYDQGVEQLLFMVSTLVITLFTNLLYGIFGGVLITLMLHMLLAKVGFVPFFKMIFRSGSKVYAREDGSYDVKIRGVANFLSVLSINKLLDTIPRGKVVRIDLLKTSLVDLSLMENLIEYKRIHDGFGGSVTLSGLDHHWSSSSHNRALKIIVGPRKKPITQRQIQLQKLSIAKGWSFEKEVDWDTSYLRNFSFFESRPIERKTNVLRGKDAKHNVNWEIADITFDEGAMLSLEVFHSTIQVVRLDREIPKFSVEKEGLFDKIFDRVKAFSGYTDHNLKLYPKVSKKFLLMGENDSTIEQFFNKELIQFLEESNIQHIESNGEALMIFRYLHIAPTEEIQNMLDFSVELLDHMNVEANA
ncbi:MAG: SulP family inorganic anion transporter [Cyclobacteriaceae bacterium]